MNNEKVLDKPHKFIYNIYVRKIYISEVIKCQPSRGDNEMTSYHTNGINK